LTGAGAVVALVMIEWATGWIAVSAWSQSWNVVRRGHFRISAWAILGTAVLGLLANSSAVADVSDAGFEKAALWSFIVLCGLYLVVQYSRTDLPGVVVGSVAAAGGVVTLVAAASLLEAWPEWIAALHLVAGAAALGSVTSGMMLGHWYLNQPGLKPWALARISTVALWSTVATGVLGLATASKLWSAETEGAILGMPGFGDSFGKPFFIIWIALVAFTVAIVRAARKCVTIRSIQSATGLYYVALLTVGVAEFLVRYLMVYAS
jgi:hypothetical protein